MGDKFPKKTHFDVQGLLCPNTLKAALRASRENDLPAREGLKELLANPNLPTKDQENNSSALPQDPEFSRWERCLEVLVEEFLSRRFELTSLNKARRTQIEEFLKQRVGAEVTLEAAVQSRMGSQEFEALQLFAYQASVFYLLQILLLKRWVDRGSLVEDCLKLSNQTLNWQITTFLKRNSPKGMMARHDWSFLKQNMFSWFSPSKETWERLRLLMESVSLAKEDNHFPFRLLNALGVRSRLSLLGFNPSLIDSRSLWRLLLEQKAFDLRLDSAADLDFSSEVSGAILVSGLRNGESLNALRELSERRELHGVWAFTDSDFERYLSEMYILWDCASEIPQINIHGRSVLKELSKDTKGVSLFGNGVKVPYQAQFGACFQDGDGKELDDAGALLDNLREGGLLLVTSDHFWPTENNDQAERMRESVLRKANVRLIIDLRQLTGAEGESFPRAIAVLEKCASKELRDSNRPQILRVRGHLQSHQVPVLWNAIIEHVRHESFPGEVSIKPLSSLGDGVKLEAMAAAASQNQLRSSPWITLSDPSFYDASGRLRRTPSKAFTLGTILRWKTGTKPPSERAVILQETEKHLLAHSSNAEKDVTAELPSYLFLPEASLVESPMFYVSQIYSAPVQFWYRLELEQNFGKRGKQIDRQSEQRLKLMPMVRLFDSGTLLTVNPFQSACASLDDAKRELNQIFRGGSLGMSERSKIHHLVVSLENSVRQNIELCNEFTKHLFPSLTITRSEIPTSLPEIAPHLALDIFRHLDRSPLLHHPAVHVTKLRNVHDFKVTNIQLEEMAMGGIAELKVFHGIDPVMKMTGPSLILKAAAEELHRKIGRPWRETCDRLLYPTDFMLVQTQLKEVLKSIEQQLTFSREHLTILDQIFCCLFGLSSSFADDASRQAIRRHLSPDESRVHVHFQKDHNFYSPSRREDSESPRGFLQ